MNRGFTNFCTCKTAQIILAKSTTFTLAINHSTNITSQTLNARILVKKTFGLHLLEWHNLMIYDCKKVTNLYRLRKIDNTVTIMDGRNVLYQCICLTIFCHNVAGPLCNHCGLHFGKPWCKSISLPFFISLL